jgi:transcriptional regulator with XRE-family HTH domain
MKASTISQTMKRLREQRGLSQLALAKKSGVAQGYISDIEAGRKHNPGIETLQKIAKVLKVTIKELLP